MKKAKKHSVLTDREASEILHLHKKGGLKVGQIAGLKGRALSTVYELCKAGDFGKYKENVKKRFDKYFDKKQRDKVAKMARLAKSEPATPQKSVVTDPVATAINNLTAEVKNLTSAWLSTPVKKRGILG